MIAEFLFLLFVVMAAAGAIMMVLSRNPVASLMYLVLNLFALAGLFVLLDAHFLAAVQVIVYAGAIMVLFLFVIMLLNLGHYRDPQVRGMFSRGVALVLGSAMFAAIGTMLRAVEVVPAGVEPTVSAKEAMLAVDSGRRLRTRFTNPFSSPMSTKVNDEGTPSARSAR